MSCSNKGNSELFEVYLKIDNFGEIEEKGVKQIIKRFTWKSTSKVEIQVINYGGTITSIKVPDRDLKIRDVVLGFNKIEDYLKEDNPYFGCTVGRVANRIAQGKMKIEGKEYKLAINNGPNHLHGGIKGFDKVVWDYTVRNNQLILSYLSPDLEEGYPGALLVNVTFELNELDEFIINYKAVTTKPTVVNLTNHSYFNLAGDHTGFEDIYKHQVYIDAKEITEVNVDLIPTGKFLQVKDTPFDFTKPQCLGNVINCIPGGGFDHNFCLTPCGGLQKVAARVKDPGSGRVLEVYTDQRGIQFYTGNFLPEDCHLNGKNGIIKKHGAFCLETQNFPDSVNQAKFPSPLLYPGETYSTSTIYKFLVE